MLKIDIFFSERVRRTPCSHDLFYSSWAKFTALPWSCVLKPKASAWHDHFQKPAGTRRISLWVMNERSFHSFVRGMVVCLPWLPNGSNYQYEEDWNKFEGTACNNTRSTVSNPGLPYDQMQYRELILLAHEQFPLNVLLDARHLSLERCSQDRHSERSRKRLRQTRHASSSQKTRSNRSEAQPTITIFTCYNPLVLISSKFFETFYSTLKLPHWLIFWRIMRCICEEGNDHAQSQSIFIGRRQSFFYKAETKPMFHRVTKGRPKNVSTIRKAVRSRPVSCQECLELVCMKAQ